MIISTTQQRAIDSIIALTEITPGGTDAIELYGPGAETYFVATTYPHKAGYAALRPKLVGFGQSRGGAREDLLDAVIDEVIATSVAITSIQ